MTNNPQIDWNYNELCGNANITIEIIIQNIDKLNDEYYFSRNPNVTWDISDDYPGTAWNYEIIVG